MAMYDLSQGSSKHLLDYLQEQIFPEGWNDEDFVRLYNYVDGRIELLDVKTGVVTILGTPTPTP